MIDTILFDCIDIMSIFSLFRRYDRIKFRVNDHPSVG